MALRIDDVDLVRDRTLVERFQAGDESAFDELYKRYHRRLERFCVKRVGDQAEAEEVAQEAFVRAYRAMPRLAGERRFYPWVSVIAARLCVDTHRRRARTQPTEDIDLGSTDGGQHEIIAQVDIDLLNQAMAQLGPRHREVLELREREGWSYQRIAEHYDVSLSTVEALLFRARKALRREFTAVAGDTPRGWAFTFPGLGWVARKAAAIRAKAQDLDHVLPHLVAGGAAAVAIGSAAIIGTGTAQAVPPAVLAGPTPVLATGVAPPVTVDAPARTAAVVTTTTTSTAAGAPSATRAADPTAAPPAAVARTQTALRGVTTGSGASARKPVEGDVAIDLPPTHTAIVNVPGLLDEQRAGIEKVLDK